VSRGLRTKILIARIVSAPSSAVRIIRLRRVVAEVRSGSRDLADEETLDRLRSLWGNEKSTAGVGLLAEIVSVIRTTGGATLECGSGLTTIVVQLATEGSGSSHYALENDARWRAIAMRRLRFLGMNPNAVVHAPVILYSGFEWYDVLGLPSDCGPFTLVVCDGPRASTTKGGRYGLIPVMRDRLDPSATVLLDDSSRESEAAVLGEWVEQFGVVICRERAEGVGKDYAILRLAE